MIRSTMLSAVALCGLFLLGRCDAADFAEFTSKAGGFKVQLPGMPTEETKEVNGSKITIYTAENDTAFFLVSYTDMPFTAERLATETEKTLDGARRGVLEPINGKLLKETKLTLDGKHFGREIQAEANLPGKQGVVRARIFLVDKRLFNLTTIGTAEAMASPDIDKFLQSLALTK